MAIDVNGNEFSWHNVKIIDKAACCFFRINGDSNVLEVHNQQTIFDSWEEAEREIIFLRKEEDTMNKDTYNTMFCASCNYAEGTEIIYGILYCTSCANI